MEWERQAERTERVPVLRIEEEEVMRSETDSLVRDSRLRCKGVFRPLYGAKHCILIRPRSDALQGLGVSAYDRKDGECIPKRGLYNTQVSLKE